MDAFDDRDSSAIDLDGQAMNDHWDNHARQWEHVGPPLRPGPVDVLHVESLLEEMVISQALLLGVTPELASMRWPRGTMLAAVDHNPEMVAHIWPHNMIPVPAVAVLGEWQRLPFRDNSIDVVLGDGCYTLLVGSRSYEALSREVSRVLRPDGRFIMRFFVRPEQPESLAIILDDLRHNRIGNFHVFKWRLAMALHRSFASGVAVADVWKEWKATGINADVLVRELDWSRSAIETMDVYRASDARYSFATLKELRASLAPYFCEVSCCFPSYELGDRCPTFLLVPKC